MLRRALRPLQVKVANMIARGVVTSTDDAKKVQELQVDLLEGETRDEVQHFQHYGLTSVPAAGADCLVVAIGGRRDQLYCIGVEDQRTRIINLNEGEVALYSKHGQTIILKTNGDIELNPKAGQVVAVGGQTNPIAKGDSLNSAITTLATSIGSAVGGIPTGGTVAAGLIAAAVGVFNASSAAALSTKAKIS